MQQPILLLLFISLLQPISAYILHSYTFPNIPYSAGVYHIHSPAYFMEAHGFALPGFQITKTCAPKWMGNYLVSEFNFTTHFGGPMMGKMFSGTQETSHILVRDCNGEACIMGRLRVRKLSTKGHVIYACGDLLQPSRLWERILGGQRLVKREKVEQAIKKGYSNFKYDMNMMLYVNLLMNVPK